MMQRRILSFLLLIMLITLVGCGQSGKESGAFHSRAQSESAAIKAPDQIEAQNERGLELLKEQYPEYFELSSFKGVEVFVWETADGSDRCGIMSGTNRMKTGSEIQALEQKSLSIAEAKMILEENGIENSLIWVIPITQPYPDSDDTNISKPYILDEERAERFYELFAH